MNKTKFIVVFSLLLLSAVSHAAVVWDGTSAAWTKGSGTEADPYLIETPQHLVYLSEMISGGISTYSGKYFKQMNDFNFNSLSWTPVGISETYCFQGVYNGNNKYISNVKYSSANSNSYNAIFGYAKGATISNLTSQGTFASGGSYAAGILAYGNGVKINNCKNNAKISGSKQAAGIIAYTVGTCTITNCSNTGAVSSSIYSSSYILSSGTYSGGIVGYNNGTCAITNCSNTGDVSSSHVSSSSSSYLSSHSYSGGIVGYNSGTCTITNCSNTGAVSSSSSSSSTHFSSSSSFYPSSYSYSGGIVGYKSGTCTITNCSNTGAVSSSSSSSSYYSSSYSYSYSGGIVGCGKVDIISSYARCTVTATGSASNTSTYAAGLGYNISSAKNSYFVGTLEGKGKYGISDAGTVTNCYFNTDCGASTSSRGTAKTKSVMRSTSFPILLNNGGTEVFFMDYANINDGYPIFAWQSSETYTITFNTNGGDAVSPTSKTVSPGGTYGTMPTPARTGYTFDGWYTAASGGTKIESATIVTITANQTLYAHWLSNNTEKVLPGKFSISDSTMIRFAPGNLQYRATLGTHACADGTTKPGVWRFADHQWDIIGSTNVNRSSDYNGWIDVFGWGTSGWNSGAVCYLPWSNSTTNSDYINQDLQGSYAYADWGVYNAISNGGQQPNLWRLLTYNEACYLLSYRPHAADKWAVGCVNNVEGLILLPDNWSLPSGVDFIPGGGSSESLSAYKEKNVYTAEQWALMELNGAVFLPDAGFLRFDGYKKTHWIQYSISRNGDTECRYTIRCNGVNVAITASDKYKAYAEPIRLFFRLNTIKVIANSSDFGITTGSEKGIESGETRTISATPSDCYRFVRWSDGNTSNPRTVTVTGDATYTAIFEKVQYTITTAPDNAAHGDTEAVEKQ